MVSCDPQFVICMEECVDVAGIAMAPGCTATRNTAVIKRATILLTGAPQRSCVDGMRAFDFTQCAT